MNLITNYLQQYFDEIEPKDFYRNIFPKGELQEKGDDHYGDGKFNGIIIEITEDMYINKKGREKPVVKRHTLTDDLDKIDEVCSRNNFCLMSALDYRGKTRDSSNARNMYALIVEIDGLIVEEDKPWGIMNLFRQIEVAERVPKPTYIVSSGNGIHLYYVFSEPLYLFENVYQQLEVYKKELTRLLWNDMVTNLSGDDIQYEPICQGFRVVGTRTKNDDLSIRARAFEIGEKVTIEYLNEFVDEEFKVKEFAYKSTLTLSQAKDKYPEWYNKRIIRGEKKGSWNCDRAVYDWWKRKLESGASCGHRYWCLRVLSVYAIKCGVSEEELEKDVLSYLEFMDKMTEGDFTSFTKEDCLASLEGYDTCWKTYPIDKIIYRTGIQIKKNKRNGRKQQIHIKYMNNQRAFKVEMGECTNGGRPKGSGTKEEIVLRWREEYPEGKKIQCHKDTGFSRVTINKYWQ